MRLLVLLSTILFCVSCTNLVTKLEAAADKADLALQKANTILAVASDRIEAADANKDGTVSWDELMLWLGGLLGLGGVTGRVAFSSLARKVETVDEKRSDSVRRVNERVNTVERALPPA